MQQESFPINSCISRIRSYGTGFFLVLHHLLGDKYLPRVVQGEAISLAELYGYAQALLFKEKPSYIRSIVKVVTLLSVSAGLQAGIVLSVRRYIPPGHVAQEAIVKAIGALHTISMVSGAAASRLGGSELREPSEMHFAAIVLSSIAAVLSMVSASESSCQEALPSDCILILGDDLGPSVSTRPPSKPMADCHLCVSSHLLAVCVEISIVNVT